MTLSRMMKPSRSLLSNKSSVFKSVTPTGLCTQSHLKWGAQFLSCTAEHTQTHTHTRTLQHSTPVHLSGVSEHVSALQELQNSSLNQKSRGRTAQPTSETQTHAPATHNALWAQRFYTRTPKALMWNSVKTRWLPSNQRSIAITSANTSSCFFRCWL